QLDAIAPRRTEMEFEGTRAPQRVVSQLMSELDGMEQRSQVMVVGATNNISIIDPSILRPGRFGVHIHVGLPDEAGRAEILRIQLRSAALTDDTTLDDLIAHLVPQTAGYAGADLAFLTQGAKHRALEEAGYTGEPGLAVRHFDAALEELGAQLRQADGIAQPSVRG